MPAVTSPARAQKAATSAAPSAERWRRTSANAFCGFCSGPRCRRTTDGVHSGSRDRGLGVVESRGWEQKHEYAFLVEVRICSTYCSNCSPNHRSYSTPTCCFGIGSKLLRLFSQRYSCCLTSVLPPPPHTRACIEVLGGLVGDRCLGERALGLFGARECRVQLRAGGGATKVKCRELQARKSKGETLGVFAISLQFMASESLMLDPKFEFVFRGKKNIRGALICG